MKSTLACVATDTRFLADGPTRVYPLTADAAAFSPRRGVWLVVHLVAAATATEVADYAWQTSGQGATDGLQERVDGAWQGRTASTLGALRSLVAGACPAPPATLDLPALRAVCPPKQQRKKRAPRARKPGSLESGQRLLA